jgi:hypothetical protein
MTETKNRRKKLPRARDTQLRKKFGISLIQYNRLLSEQNHVCYICKGTDDYSDNLAVDHCHKTNIVRGLLCRDCNRALGQFRDNVDNLQRAIEYLQRTPPNLTDIEPKAPPKPHNKRARIRYQVTTPAGVFDSYEDAGEHYKVHSCTIREWCMEGGRWKKPDFNAIKTFKGLE